MVVTLGKRKRVANATGTIDESGSGDEDARALFQRAFEAKFKPLKSAAKPVVAAAETKAELQPEILDVDISDSDWSGFSGDEEEELEAEGVEIVNHGVVVQDDDEDMRKAELKAFMSSKPPTSEQRAVKLSKPPKEDASADVDESTNLKHDLALQRLLKESHLLAPSSSNGATVAPVGKSRLKALDLRLRDLGAKKAVTEQERMPIAHRKGIVAKAASREASRRKEAVENGIILERAKMAARPEQRRERGVDAPGVGKFRGGTLKLSSRDVKSIESEGPKQRTGGKGRKK
ncbi:hypothetical protein LTR08_008094 [Meristemomyces frigidus]|nr:hypothetical protein LTR08_008094 [Meristemomyces frigidus]